MPLPLNREIASLQSVVGTNVNNVYNQNSLKAQQSAARGGGEQPNITEKGVIPVIYQDTLPLAAPP
jgi:hypothetical protein